MNVCPVLVGFVSVGLFVGASLGVEQVATGGAAASPTTQASAAGGVIRIKAGQTAALTDKAGNVWKGETGFTDGEVIDRAPDLKIEGTETPELYRTERYDMSKFAMEVPNGKYLVKLHFAETYEDVSAAGERVFSFDVEGQKVTDFDVFKEAGGKQKALVKEFKVEVKDGKLDIGFTAKVQAPMINAIEIVPQT